MQVTAPGTRGSALAAEAVAGRSGNANSTSRPAVQSRLMYLHRASAPFPSWKVRSGPAAEVLDLEADPGGEAGGHGFGERLGTVVPGGREQRPIRSAVPRSTHLGNKDRRRPGRPASVTACARGCHTRRPAGWNPDMVRAVRGTT